MAIRSFERSICRAEREWNPAIEAAQTAKLSPSALVHRTAVRTAADDIGREDARLTPEQAELIKRTSRSTHVPNHVMHLELFGVDRDHNFETTAGAARIAQSETMGPDGSDASARDAPSMTRVGVAGR